MSSMFQIKVDMFCVCNSPQWPTLCLFKVCFFASFGQFAMLAVGFLGRYWQTMLGCSS